MGMGSVGLGRVRVRVRWGGEGGVREGLTL